MPRPPTRPRLAAVLALGAGSIAAALLAAGCGSEAEQVSASELIARGDSICAQGRREFDRIQRRDSPNAAAAAEQLEQLIEVASDELTELRTIRPPEALRERYGAYLAARGRALELLRQGLDAAEQKDPKAYARAQSEAAAEQGRRLELARAVGFEQCSRR